MSRNKIVQSASKYVRIAVAGMVALLAYAFIEYFYWGIKAGGESATERDQNE